MQAVTVTPGVAHSSELRDVPAPSLADAPRGRGVLVDVIRVGLDGTDREIDAGEYGVAPAGSPFLVLGHESLGTVREVGDAVHELAPGDLVVARVRRAGTSLYDAIGMPDMTTDEEVSEHGISRVHGFLTEAYVEEPEYLIRVPEALRDVAVLLEPLSIVEKAVTQALEVQRRLKVWTPGRVAVLGAGAIGLLATMALRARGLRVVTMGLEEAPNLRADLVAALGATYESTSARSLAEIAGEHGRFDLIVEATGFSPIVFEATRAALAKNGVMVLTSVTGGEREVQIPSDAINLDLVLGNKVLVGSVNANREHFEAGVRDLAVARTWWPGWLERLLTHRVHGLGEWSKALELLGAPDVIKVVVEVAERGG